MNNIKNLLKSKYLIGALLIGLGAFIGWFLSTPGSHQGHNHELVQTESGVWTCSMHPQIKQDKPGKCPICAMDLVQLHSNKNISDDLIPADAIQMSEEAVALANVQTSVVSKANPVKRLSLYGKIVTDERRMQSQTAHVGGRIERLNIEFTGETVRSGQTLATLYSPELQTAQQELLEALKTGQTQLIEAARNKLKQWKITPSQIAAIEKSGVIKSTTDIKANTSGIVIVKRVNQGDYVQQGAVLFEVADLSNVWAVFDAYEADLPFLSKGETVYFTLSALPGKTVTGKIAFIDPIINPTTRTARIRVDVANPGLVLKPEMYATATIDASLKSAQNGIVIPRSAVLWTGKRSVVYVKQPDISTPAFILREVELGSSLGNSYIVISGLSEGEEIVTNGVFAVDASAQLEGKRSMMNNNTGASIPNSGHAHHQTSDAKAKHMEHVMFKVNGACDMCKTRIEKAALSVDGVTSAQWDQKTETIHLELDPTKASADQVSKAIAKVGHDTESHKASQATYDALPGCCKYRK